MVKNTIYLDIRPCCMAMEPIHEGRFLIFLLTLPIEVDLPNLAIENGDFPYSYVKLSEGYPL